MILFVWNRISQAARIKIFALLFALMALMAISFMGFKLSAFKGELSTINYDAIVQRVTGTGQYHVRVAREIYSDHPAFGVGGWGYPHYQMQYMTPEEIKGMQITGGANVHNDTRQFLAEHGYVGFGVMLACVLSLLIPLLISLCRLILNSFKISKADPESKSPTAHWFYCIPPPLIAVLMGTLATVIHSTGDLPFRTPAILTVWMLAFVCVPGWIPILKRKHK